MANDAAATQALAAVIKTARGLVRAGNWEAAQPDRLYRDCRALGLFEPQVSLALRAALNEITPEDGHIREDTADELVCKGQALYEFCWESPSRTVLMYFKFCVFDERCVIVSFHKSKLVDIATGTTH